jgi:hypothetical protein
MIRPRFPAGRELVTLEDARDLHHEAAKSRARGAGMTGGHASADPGRDVRRPDDACADRDAASSHSSLTTAQEARCGRRPKSIGSFAEDLARARVSWLISPEAPGTSHLIGQRRSDGTQGRPKRFRTSERPRNLRERNWPRPEMSVRARLILICRNGRSPQRIFLNGSKNRMKTIRLEQARLYHVRDAS